MNTTQRDPVCGMMAKPELACQNQGTTYRFCSDFCRREFLANPDKYVRRSGQAVHPANDSLRRIAYVSMEVDADARMPNYSGGLGVLAGDTVKSAADLR